MSSIKQIDQEIKTFGLETTEQMDAWVRADILDVLRSSKLSETPVETKRMWVKRCVQCAIAASVIIGLFVGLDYVGPSMDITTAAFAEAVEPIMKAKTATFTVTQEGGADLATISMKGCFSESGKMRFDISGVIEMVQIVDMIKGKYVLLMPKSKVAQVTQLTHLPSETLGSMNLFFDIRRQIKELVGNDAGEVEVLPSRTLDGIDVNGYQLTVKLGATTRFWIDAVTQQPVRIVYDMSELLGKPWKTVLSDFEFDVEFDESQFDLEVPEGYTVEAVQLDASRSAEKDLVEMFRLWAKATDGRFPSALNLNVDVLSEFTKTLTKALVPLARSEETRDRDTLFQIVGDVKKDLAVLRRIIQEDDGGTEEELLALALSVKSNLQGLETLKKDQEKSRQEYRDQLRARSNQLQSNPLKNVQDIREQMTPVTQGLMFVLQLPANSDWHYAGENATFGDADTPIFWYRPKGLGRCRVIYADLRCLDVPFSEQPQEPKPLLNELPEQASDVAQTIDSIRHDQVLEREKEFIDTLRLWTAVIDGVFPASLDSSDMVRDLYDYQRRCLYRAGRSLSQQHIEPIRKDVVKCLNEIRRYIMNGLRFVRMLDADSDWHYAGRGELFGDSDKTIFWYKPKGCSTYRVIFADMRVEETPADQLPIGFDTIQGSDNLRDERFLQEENVFIEALRMWIDTIDDRFPSSFDSFYMIMDLLDFQRKQNREGRQDSSEQSDSPIQQPLTEDQTENRKSILKGLGFVFSLNADSDWYYAGRGELFGDSDKPIFWYKPKGCSTYRVIYADLTVEETAVDLLPEYSGKTQGYADLHKAIPPKAVSEPAALELLEKIQGVYSEFDSYYSESDILVVTATALVFDEDNLSELTEEQRDQLEENSEFKAIFNRQSVSETSLVVKLTLPEQYCIEWTTRRLKDDSSYSEGESGCMWSDSEGYYKISHGKLTVHDRSFWGGAPWGSAEFVPTMFYKVNQNVLKQLNGLVIEDDEVVNGQLCYVVSGLRFGLRIKLWISKERLLLLKRKSEINFESTISSHSKSANKRILQVLGMDYSPEAIHRLEERRGNGFARKTRTTGWGVEKYRDIIVNEPIPIEDLKPFEEGQPNQ